MDFPLLLFLPFCLLEHGEIFLCYFNLICHWAKIAEKAAMQIEWVNLFSSHCQRGEGCKADLKHTDFHIFINLSISFNLSTKVVLFITFLCNICICFFFQASTSTIQRRCNFYCYWNNQHNWRRASSWCFFCTFHVSCQHQCFHVYSS